MDILLDNPLATMYGPYFLVLYGFVIFFTLVTLGLIKTRIDDTDQMAVPPIPSVIDPFEIAYLRGGTNELTRSVVFSLLQKGFIEIRQDSNKPEIKQTNTSLSAAGLSQLEQRALGWFYVPRETSEVFRSGGLNEQLEEFGQSYQAGLEQRQMLTSAEMRASYRPLKWAAFLVIFGLGAYKFIASIAHGYYNVIFLFIFCLVGLVIAGGLSRFKRLTKLGRAYLERLQLAFDTLKYEAQRPYLPSGRPPVAQNPAFAGVDPLLLSVGVFGPAILAGTIYDDYNMAFQRAQTSSGVSGSSCSSGCGSGSSCSSSSGDSGGSSCSSGSSCGGGCGGGGCS